MPDTNLKSYFCDLLKKHIKNRKARQSDMAAVLGVSASAVSQMLSGNIMLKLQQLDSIMEFLQLDRASAAELRDCLARIRSGDQELRSPLNDFIKNSRIRCGYTFEKLSQISGIPVENLQMLENKINVQPTPYEAVRLAAIFNCNVAELWQVVPDLKPQAAPVQTDSKIRSGGILRDVNTPFVYKGNSTIKLPVIKVADLLSFNKNYDRLVDFAWRHMSSVEDGEKAGLVVVMAPGTEFGWSELYDVRIEIAEVKQWLPGMAVLCNIDGELYLARALQDPWQVLIQGMDEPCSCELCWMVNSLNFLSELFNVTTPAKIEHKIQISVFGKNGKVGSKKKN